MKHAVIHRRSRQRGSLLMLVLWAVAVLSLTVLAVLELLSSSQDETIARNKQFHARMLAESGLAIASHPRVDAGDPLLSKDFENGDSFRVTITSESARININYLLEKKDETTLRNLFRSWDIDLNDSNMIIDCLTDWVDADDLRSLNGAERGEYAKGGRDDLPGNAPFTDLEQLAMVKGWNIVMEKKPDWRDMFTIYGNGKVDLNDASGEVLKAVLGLGDLATESLVKRRNGEDGIQGTQDDIRFENMDQVRVFFGFSKEQMEKLQQMVTLQDNLKRIDSTGQTGGMKQRIILVVRRGNSRTSTIARMEP
jgi:general secretion pathway protein K